jgi:hypothetical protein
MSETAVRASRAGGESVTATPLRVALLGRPVWLDCCAPTPPAGANHDPGLVCERFDLPADADPGQALAGVGAFAPDATVIIDPAAALAPSDAATPIAQALRAAGGATLGVLVGGLPEAGSAAALASLDRLVTFNPALTGAQVAGKEVWRAIPPPVGDAHFKEVRPLPHAPRSISIGRSTEHREGVLTAAKHEHDLLQVIHGVSGAALVELLGEYDVGIYLPRATGAGFGWQVGAHLAAGQLLLAATLAPAQGLERGIDYLEIDSPEGLVWLLNRLGRFPEMYQRIRVRGRLKAEQYRASRLFRRVVQDLLLDVAAFGAEGGGGR